MKTSQLLTLLLLASATSPSNAAAPTLMSGLKGTVRIALCAALVTPPACVLVRANMLRGEKEAPFTTAISEFEELVIDPWYIPTRNRIIAFDKTTEWHPEPDDAQGGFTK